MALTPPSIITVPWASSGLKNSIPANANNTTGNAGYNEGFPSVNMTPKVAGGIPPFGKDFNGIFFEITSILRYMQAGGQPTYSSAMSTAIGGYPLYAVLAKAGGVGFWRNIVANNTSDPDAGGSGWVSESSGNYSSATVITASSTTLTAAQAGQAFLFSTPSSACALPVATSVSPGSVFKIETSAGLALSVTGGAAMQVGALSRTSFVLPPGTEGVAVSTGAVWWVFGTALNDPSIGVGQSWQNLTSSRLANTTYTNSSGKPICVFVYLGLSAIQATRILVDGVVAGQFVSTGSSVNQGCVAIVPNGSTYRAENAQGSPIVAIWSELR